MTGLHRNEEQASRARADWAQWRRLVAEGAELVLVFAIELDLNVRVDSCQGRPVAVSQ